MIRNILLLAATSTLLWSCGSDNSESDATAGAPATTQNAATTNTDTSNKSNALTEAVQAKDGAVAPQNEAAGAQANSKAAGEVKLNPPHGQPGHSCAVAVGAPLTAAATAAPAAAPQPMQMAPAGPTAAPAQQLLPDGKVNPPHGQPGHVCM